MHWVDKLAEEIVQSGRYKPYRVDDMKTPSGRVHIGSVRAFLTHAYIHQALSERGEKTIFSYVFEDHDPFDKIPTYLDSSQFEKHLGKPLYRVPSPEPGYDSYGQRWAHEYQEIFDLLGIEVEIIWGSQLYLSEKMNGVVRECLDKAEKIREIYEILYEQKKSDAWLPVSMVCEQCGKLSTTEAGIWDGEKVHYKCKVDAVKWTKGCGFEGKRSPFDGNAKLPWKVEWPCKWKVIGVTIEGAGKDHMSDGGSHDFAKLMCERVLDYPVPYSFSHEFFLIGGKKMSSSKGVGSSAKEISEIIPSYLIKFAVSRVRFNRAINFDPMGMTIPDLFDEFDETAKIYWTDVKADLSRAFDFSKIGDTYDKQLFLPRFRDVANFLQNPKMILVDEFGKTKGEALTQLEIAVLEERVKYAKIWLEKYAPENFKFQVSEQDTEGVQELTQDQIKYLNKVSKLLETEITGPEELQQQLYNLSQELGLPTAKAFQAIYLVLIGKNHGPKAGWLLFENLESAKKKLSHF